MRKFFTMLTIVALATVGAVACGGDDDEGSSDTTEASDDTSDDTTDGTTDDTSTGNDALDDLLAKSKEATYKVTYSSDGGDDVVIAQDPPRFAYVTGDSGIYQTEDGTAVSCSGISDPASAQCIVVSGAGESFVEQTITAAFGAAFLGIFAAADEDDDLFGTIETSDDEIAGRDATCATIDPGASPLIPATGSITVCVDTETGVTLRYTTENANGEIEQTLEATDFGEPDDADLDPPAEPTEITIPTIPS